MWEIRNIKNFVQIKKKKKLNGLSRKICNLWARIDIDLFIQPNRCTAVKKLGTDGQKLHRRESSRPNKIRRQKYVLIIPRIIHHNYNLSANTARRRPSDIIFPPQPHIEWPKFQSLETPNTPSKKKKKPSTLGTPGAKTVSSSLKEHGARGLISRNKTGPRGAGIYRKSNDGPNHRHRRTKQRIKKKERKREREEGQRRRRRRERIE